jgi:hypothetical protein
MLKCSALVYALVWLFLGYQGTCARIIGHNPRLMWTVCLAGWAVYLPLVFLWILRSNRTGRRIAREDFGESTTPSRPLESSSLSIVHLVSIFRLAMVIAGLATVGALSWIHSIPQIRPVWPLYLVLAALSHYCFWRLYQRGLAISEDQEAFDSCPPAGGVTMNSIPSGKATSRRFSHDLFMLLGGLFGPAAPIIVHCFQTGGLLAGGITVGAGALAVLVPLVLRRSPRWSRRAVFASLMFMGIFDAFMVELGYLPMGSPLPRHAVAAVYAGLYGLLAVAYLSFEGHRSGAAPVE